MIYDLAIIGGGPGGYVAAERAGNAGKSVVLFERGELGGVCLNEGCIPTKALLNCAKMLDHARRGKTFGVNASDVQADFGKMMERKTRVVRRLVGGVKASVKAAGATVIKAEATIIGGIDGNFRIQAAGEEYTAAKLLICTGSSATIPPIPGLNESAAVITSREALSLPECPNSLAIIGGGVIGMEFAAFYNSLGTKVTVIEMLPEILGGMDAETGAGLRAVYATRGVVFNLGCRVTAVEGGAVLFTDAEGNPQRIEAEKILVSTGRRPNVSGFGLEALGVQTARGIVVDSHLRTSVPGVYAAGDVTGFSMLAHTASREAEVAVNDMLRVEDEMSYNAVPGVVYTSPEAAGVGVTSEKAPEGALTLRLPMAYSGRYVAENEDISGFCKIIADGATRRVLGVHMLGTPCSEVISAACLAIENKMTVGQLQKVIFPHPSVAEIIKETVYLKYNQ